MLQGDQEWWRLAETIAREDHAPAIEYNLRASPERRLLIAAGPIPCVGAVTTAPVVLLLLQPALEARSTWQDHSFRRPGWPLAALHPEAPPGLSSWWRARLEGLIDLHGAQHVSNSVAAIYLTPWYAIGFDDRLRLPSRKRQLELAGKAAARDALMLMPRGEFLWTESPEVASLPATRRLHAKSWRSSDVNAENLGEDAWEAVRKRIEIHAWL
jgi:hypothetical protein